MIRVRVPATSANLGPGFDCLALALDLFNETDFELTSSRSWHVTIDGEGKGKLSTGAENLIVQAVHRLYQAAGKAIPSGMDIRCCNRIPFGSGLGSSAAAIVAGLTGANALLGSPFNALQLLELAAEMESHPDNAAAAILGGLVLVAGGDRLTVRKVVIPPIPVMVVVPDFQLPTQSARAVLSERVARADAVFNMGKAVLVVEALRNGDLALLDQAMQDRLHQPYRLPLIPGAEQAMQAARRAGAAAVALSGAGPGLIAFGQGDLAPVGEAMQDAFNSASLTARCFQLRSNQTGVEIVGEGESREMGVGN